MLFNLIFSNPMIALAWFVAIIIAITFHEFSHAWASYMLGDPTSKNLGRLTLNPLKHLDLIGTLLLVFVGFGWGKPVPFNPYNLKNQKWGPALVSVAGPVMNITLALVFGIGLKLIVVYSNLPMTNGLIQLLNAIVIINIILAVFNLIPVPPLDGSKILYAILPQRFSGAVVTLEKWGPFVLIFMVIFAGTLFGALFSVIVNWVYGLIF